MNAPLLALPARPPRFSCKFWREEMLQKCPSSSWRIRATRCVPCICPRGAWPVQRPPISNPIKQAAARSAADLREHIWPSSSVQDRQIRIFSVAAVSSGGGMGGGEESCSKNLEEGAGSTPDTRALFPPPTPLSEIPQGYRNSDRGAISQSLPSTLAKPFPPTTAALGIPDLFMEIESLVRVP